MSFEFIRLTEKELEEAMYIRVDTITSIIPLTEYLEKKDNYMVELARLDRETIFSRVVTTSGMVDAKEKPFEISRMIETANSELENRIKIVDSYELNDYDSEFWGD